VRRVQGLTSLSCFSELNLSLGWFFFLSVLCLFCFLGFSLAGWFLRVIGSVVYWFRFPVSFPEAFVSRVLYLIAVAESDI
jgi:hypothetical protein